MTHKLIAIEGVNRSTTATLAKSLQRRLEAQGRPARVFTFPDIDAPTGRMLTQLRSQSRAPIAELPMLLSIANRYERRDPIKAALQAGATVICDRYTATCTAWGEADGLDPNWIDAALAGMPIADETILVTASGSRVPAKTEATYERLADAYGWIRVDGGRTPAEAADQAWRVLKTVLGVTDMPLAIYGYRALNTEVRIYRDDDCPNPLHEEKRLELLTLRYPGNPLGDRQMDADELAEKVKRERAAGRPVYGLYVDDKKAYHYTMKDCVDELETWMAGIIVAVDGSSDSDDGMKAEAQRTIKRYGLWLNRNTYRFEEWRVPGDPEPSTAPEGHTMVNAERGFIGEGYEKSGVLEAAGVVEQGTRELMSGWKTIVT